MNSNAALRLSRTPLRMNHAQSTGNSVNVTIKEPTSAKTIVSAIGLNSVPEGPEYINGQKPATITATE